MDAWMDEQALPAPEDAVRPNPPDPPEARRPVRRHTDEEIFAALRAGEAEGASAADLCAAHDITLPLYCVWKRKYGALTLEELRAVRHQEGRRRRVLTAAGLAAGAASLIAIAALLLPGVSVDAPAAEAAQARRPAALAVESPPRSVPADAVAAAREEVAAAALAGAYDLPADDEGFAVQIAAKPDLREARDVVDRLRAAGHSAYLLATTVEDVELFRVRVGPFPTRHAAAAAARQLEREGYDGAWMVR